MDDTIESLTWNDHVSQCLQAGVCPIVTAILPTQPWWEYCGNTLTPGMDTCDDHQT